MDSSQIDARGKSCPLPLMFTKQALNDSKIPDKFILLIDCKTSRENVERFLKDNHILYETRQDEDCFRISINKPE